MPLHRCRRAALVAGLTGLAAFVSASPANATYPGRNGLIAFHSDTDQGAQIFTVRENGRDLRQITHVSGHARLPDWSPDGRRIAFELEAADRAGVAIMNADGSDLVRLPLAPGVFEGDPSFTPDGRRIVFVAFDGETEGVWSMKLDGSDRRLITTAGAPDPNVSPDGRRLAFLGFDGEPFGQALFTSRIDGGHPAPITPFSFNVGFKHDWAPDGRRLAFIHNADFAFPDRSANIATIRPNGTGLRFVTNYRGGDVNAFFGSYSPDGRRIAFRLEHNGRFGLFKLRPDGKRIRPILRLSDFAPRFIDWGPSARHRLEQRDGREDDDREHEDDADR
jgi:Tol biopolymer transport system component